jgi:hypothetical protein
MKFFASELEILMVHLVSVWNNITASDLIKQIYN